MKKLFVFLLLLFTPSIIAGFLLYRFFPQDSQQLLEIGKVKLVEQAPILKNYLSLPAKKLEKKPAEQTNSGESSEEKANALAATIPHFTNAEVFSAVCGEEIKERFNENFTACTFCPKYLNYPHKGEQFSYFFESRGKILNVNDEEAFVIMKGCQSESTQDTLVLLRKGFGGWHKVQHYSILQMDKPPLEFDTNNGFLIYVAKKTSAFEHEFKQDIYTFQIQKDKIDQKYLFSIGMERNAKCQKTIQGSIDFPIKIDEKTFQVNLEIAGCKPNKLNGFYKLVFELKKDGVFYPNKETALLMTKIERYGENDAL